MISRRCWQLSCLSLLAVSFVSAIETATTVKPFLQQFCFDCHDTETKKGNLDLTRSTFDATTVQGRTLLVAMYDHVLAHEMPPKKKKAQPNDAERKAFLATLAAPVIAQEKKIDTQQGRTTWRRMNRFEYEATVRDLLSAPWLQIKDILPEDGELHRFNKIGQALDVSHVQMAQYLQAADYALRAVLATSKTPPKTETKHIYARDVNGMTKKMFFNEFNRAPERATFPVLGFKGQPDVREQKAPITNKKDPAIRDQEALGVVASSYEPIEFRFANFKAPMDGTYTVTLTAYSIWVGPGTDKKQWWRPDLDTVSKGRRSEPITIYAERPPRQIRRLGAVDVGVEPTSCTLNVHLLAGETIRVDAARLFRSRPPKWHNPLATKDGQPGVAFKSLEVTGPHVDGWPSAGHTLLFGDLPFTPGDKEGSGVEVQSQQPLVDGERLMRGFLARAYRHPVNTQDVNRFMSVVKRALADNNSFADAMIAGYSAALCSPGFVCLEEKPGTLDAYALATRLSYFLINSAPDDELRQAAATGSLLRDDELARQTRRLIADPRNERFRNAFLDYWLDLRKIDATSPDAELYPDYYLDDLLVESAVLETQAFFAELIEKNLPARHVVASDFVMINERLADHYGIPGVEGVAIRRVSVPKGNPRGGLLTQASVLKVTANGTTTSPVVRGAWITERILGKPVPPPPPSVPAVEPDTRGATTIREQLEKHRNDPNCASCHVKIDPPGFALESFDILGGWRDRYRAMGTGKKEIGFGKNGQPFAFHLASPVDASGELPDGRAFTDINNLKQLLLSDERQIARNIARQLTIYATGSGIRFADRPQIEAMLDRAASSHYGLADLIVAITQSDLFRRK